MTTTAPALPGGITIKDRDVLLKALAADPTNKGATTRSFTPRERVIASLMRPRDHLDGCPVFDDETASAQVEAYEELTPSPGRSLRSQGAVPGSVVVVARCMTCSGTRYFLSAVPAHVGVGQGRHVSALITHTLTADGDATGDLDGSL